MVCVAKRSKAGGGVKRAAQRCPKNIVSVSVLFLLFLKGKIFAASRRFWLPKKFSPLRGDFYPEKNFAASRRFDRFRRCMLITQRRSRATRTRENHSTIDPDNFEAFSYNENARESLYHRS